MSDTETIPAGKKFPSIRKWTTPLTMGAFLLTAGTGLGLFFEVEWGLVEPIHEWLSLALVLGALLHLWDHRNSVLKHLSGPWGKTLVAAGAILLIGAYLPIVGGSEEEEGGKLSMRELAQTIEGVPLTSLALARNLPVDSLVARLHAVGLPQANGGSTIAQLAGSDIPLKKKALSAILSGKTESGDDDEDGDEH